MRIECRHDRLAPGGAGARDYLAQDVLVAKVNAVKVAHADDSWAKAAGDFVKGAEDPQALPSDSEEIW
jgi:hypothetical protein